MERGRERGREREREREERQICWYILKQMETFIVKKFVFNICTYLFKLFVRAVYEVVLVFDV